MSPDAKAENEACQAVIAEFRAMLIQEGMPKPIIELCQQLEDRIQLRRLLDVDTKRPLNYSALGRSTRG